ncbi:MAG: protein-glutamate O-methyltransferase family protein [Deltaproteobacteria bacterium]|nr:protein-glutamate O-methyltransferase family protein [Deltaproteobacteria bacterium]
MLLTTQKSFARVTFERRLPKILTEVLADCQLSPRSRRRVEELRRSLPFGSIPRFEANAKRFEVPDRARWGDLPFLAAEMIFYLALLEALDYVEGRSPDPFARRKNDALSAQTPLAKTLAGWLESTPSNASSLRLAMRAAVAGNAEDLSQLGGPPASSENARMIVDDTERVIRRFSEYDGESVIDIVLDNAGGELVADLAMIDVLLRTHLGRVRVHCKPVPFFVSDTTRSDWDNTLAWLRRLSSSGTKAWHERLTRCMQEGRLKIATHPFWCQPRCLYEIPPSLERVLARSDLLVLKGDLNYRRYVEDRAWHYGTPVHRHRLIGLPPALMLRVVKSEVLIGVSKGLANELSLPSKNWAHSSSLAMIQLIE